MSIRTSIRPNRRRQQSGPLLIGLLCLSGAILGSTFLLSRRPPVAEALPPQPIVAQFDLVELPVPAEVVPAGTKTRNIRFRKIGFPKHQVPPGALIDIAPYLDAAAVAALPANLPVFPENFALGGGRNPLVERIPAGMRAMTIQVDATSAVEGWAGSGSVVDVLLIERDKTTVVAEKVHILSAERSLAPVDGSSSPNVPSTATLLVTQEQCLAINTAIPLGRIAFALRNVQDEQGWETTSFTAARLQGRAPLAEARETINGAAVLDDQGGKRAFALAGGKWIKAETVPDGFFVARGR